MQPGFQRYLPIILIVFVLLFVLPALFHKSKSKGPSSSTLSDETIAATQSVDKAEMAFKAEHKGYTSHVSDLVTITPSLSHAISDGILVKLDVSTDGQTYLAQVVSTYLSMTRGREGEKQIAKGCVVVKSGSGVACPVKPAPKGSSTTTTTTTSTTTTSTTAG